VNLLIAHKRTVPPKTDDLRRLRNEGGFFVLGDCARVRVTGADRLRYLNGQLSNDLGRLSPGEAMAALLLTAKGKLCADVFVWIEGESLIVEADAALEEALAARLERYAVADDVAFERLPPAVERWHVFGSVAAGRDGVRICRLGVEGVDVLLPPDGLLEAGREEVELLRIERGVPRWGTELSEETLPQEVGLDRTAVDFHKGCYVGQEVVSRIHSVGRVNRHLSGFVGEFEASAARVATLVDAAGRKSGRLTSAAYHPELRKAVALGFLQGQVTGAAFSIEDETGACLGKAERSEFPLLSS
jgi:tRNA-modifying protein YgfZ